MTRAVHSPFELVVLLLLFSRLSSFLLHSPFPIHPFTASASLVFLAQAPPKAMARLSALQPPHLFLPDPTLAGPKQINGELCGVPFLSSLRPFTSLSMLIGALPLLESFLVDFIDVLYF